MIAGMSTTTGRFDLTRWDEDTYHDEHGVRLVAVSVAKAFEGGISGTSTARLLQALAKEGAAAYVGIEHVSAAVDGRSGTFLLQHCAVASDTGRQLTVEVVPNSGSGQLAGISGELTITVSPEGEHTYSFTYELG